MKCFTARYLPPAICAALLHFLCLSELVGADPQEGELNIYAFTSSVGIVANRVIRDTEGRVVKTIYYKLDTKNSSHEGPYSEEMLVVASIVLHKYDQHGRKSREEHYSSNMVLRRIQETSYQGSNKKSVWLRADGTREYEIRYSGNRSISHLYFDCTGKRLIGIDGVIPPDIELACGWGQPIDGLACGIGANKPTAVLKHVEINVTVRNLTASPVKVITALQYHTVRMELRDAEGTLVPQNRDYIEERNRDLIRMNRGENENLQTVPAHQAKTFTGGYELAEWYAGLAPGTYYLAVRRRTSGEEFPLVSNTIKLEILAGQ